MPTSDEFICAELSRLAWQETAGRGANIANAVMLVQSNRIHAGWMDGDWLKVFAQQRRQWNAWRPEFAVEQYKACPDTRDPEFQAILAASEAVYNGAFDILTDGALYYANFTEPYDKDGWFHRNIVGNPSEHPRTATISGWSFFR